MVSRGIEVNNFAKIHNNRSKIWRLSLTDEGKSSFERNVLLQTTTTFITHILFRTTI